MPEAGVWRSRSGVLPGPTPVLALATTPAGPLAGGFGGVARIGAAGHPQIGHPQIGPVLALASAEGWVFAGGSGGLARSGDGGLTWYAGQAPLAGAPISALLAVPGFDRHGVVLAGTVGAGMLRSEDRGRTWVVAGFGLPGREITGLCAGPDATVLAATPDGVYRDRGLGRAWQSCPGTGGIAVTAVAAAPDGSLYAAAEDGRLLRAASADGEFRLWRRPGPACADLAVEADGAVLTAGPDGVHRHTAEGSVRLLAEPALCLLRHDGVRFAGTETGVSVQDLPSAPVPDLLDAEWLLRAAGGWVVAGRYGGAARLGPDGWDAFDLGGLPTSSVAADRGGTLTAAGLYGLLRTDGTTADLLTATPMDRVALDDDGTVYAAPSAGGLWRSADGAGWVALDPGFAARPPIALAAGAGGRVVAVSRDDVNQIVTAWESADSGRSWRRACTGGPGSSSAAAGPAAVALGSRTFRRAADDSWTAIGGLGVTPGRIVCAAAGTLVALAGGSVHVFRSGRWQPIADRPAGAPVTDVGVLGDEIYTVDRAGRLSSYAVPADISAAAGTGGRSLVRPR